MEMNRVIVNKKLLEINKLKKQEKELVEEIQRYNLVIFI